MFLSVIFSIAWYNADHRGHFLSPFIFATWIYLWIWRVRVSVDLTAAYFTIELLGVLRTVCHASALRAVCHAWCAFKLILGREVIEKKWSGVLLLARKRPCSP